MAGWTSAIPLYGKGVESLGYNECKSTPTPYDSSVLLRQKQIIRRDQLRYF
jgi:hypothetical protein